MKKLICLLVIVISLVTTLTSCELLVVALIGPAFKTETTVINGVEYTCQGKAKKADSFWVSGLADKSLTNVVIEPTINGKPVTKIASMAFSSCEQIKSVIIPEGITTIEHYAFSDCTGLTSIEIPKSVTRIDSYEIFMGVSDRYGAFHGCINLVEVINHSSLEITVGGKDNGQIAEYAIGVHTGESKLLEKDDYLFYMDEDANYLARYFGSETELVLPENCNGENYIIDNHAFGILKSLTSVTIPNSEISIGDYVFYNCESLKNIELPEGLTEIPKSAFEGCRSLISINIPKSVVHFGEKAFYNCESLKNIELPDGITEIPQHAFEGCRSLTSINIPDSVIGLGDYAFYNCESLKNIELPDGITEIPKSAFEGCRSLTSIIIPDSVIRFGGSAFSGCEFITDVYYKGSEAQWRKIESNFLDHIENVTIHYDYIPE